MGHKKTRLLGLSLLAVAIVIPSVVGVNHFTKSNLRADGTPIPPLPPPKPMLLADGTPIPPLPPPKGLFDGSQILVADGTPIPPLPPPKQTGPHAV